MPLHRTPVAAGDGGAPVEPGTLTSQLRRTAFLFERLMQQHLHVRLVWKPFSLREIPGGLDARSLAADQRAHSAVDFFFGRIFAKTYRKPFVLCTTHDYSSHVVACRINNLQLELAKIRRGSASANRLENRGC